jgi:mannose-1-phosphate guanylyltransferase
MKLIVLSGGSGTRLWPLSHASRPKQFLRILAGPTGQMESMVERLWRQLGEAGLQESVYFATGQEQEEHLRSLLGEDVPIILEPEQRDTFPAVALAATYLYSIVGVGLNETIVILPVDSFVDTPFFHTFNQLDDVLEQTGSNFVLIGVKPDCPSEKFGYLVPVHPHSTGHEEQGWWEVAHFHEKPSKEIAEQLMEEGALWNCGVFAFRLDYLINLLIEKSLPLQYEEMAKRYGQMKKMSFDYEVVEKANFVIAQTYEGKWKDIGTWSSLSEEIATTMTGRGYMTEDCTNTHMINELDIPIAVIGLDNVIIVAGPEGIIVADKSESHLIKSISSQFELDKTKKA